MKTTIQTLLFTMACLAGSANAAVNFTITPSAVSNTYNGTITYQIGGIPTGDTVVIQKFIDVNTNGVIDGNDWLAQQFNITDGQAGMVIGGVTNFNVPGDLDSTTGAITTTLNFYNGDFMQNVVGKYLVRLSSPLGHFTPITNVFTVTNFPFAQKFTGNVVSNGTNVPNASVMFFSMQPGQTKPNGGPLAGAIADNSGGYTIPVPPGSYMAVAFKSNYVGNMGTVPLITLGSGATVTTNVMMTNATASISGQIVGADMASLGLPGILMIAQADNGQIAVTSTDPNGYFNLRVQSGQWEVKPDDVSLVVHGYAGWDNKTNVNAGATGLFLQVPKGTALLYGSVIDNLGNPMAGIDVYVEDSDNNVWETDAYSDTNGNYFAAAPAGDWYVSVESDTAPANYIFSGNQGLTMSGGQAVLQNFTAVLATNHISGWLKDNNNNPISGVGVWASATINGVYYQLESVDTDASGNYSLNVANGIWNVGVNSGCSDCDDDLPGNYLAPANQSVGITNNNGVANFIALNPTSHITGSVKDSNNNPIVGVGVNAWATLGSEGYQTYAATDNNGNYSLNVVNGDWSVNLMCQGGPGGNYNNLDNILGNGNYQCPNVQDVNLATGNGTANFVVQLDTVQILTTNLPDGQVGVYYDAWLEALTFTGQTNWSLISGTPPPGLNADLSTGEIYGTPTASGPYTCLIQADDGNGHSAQTNVSIYIAPASSPLQVTTTSLPYGTNSIFYSQTLQASGGQPPYSWSIPDYSADPPPNLVLATNGFLSGTPAATVGWYYFDVEVTDAAMNTMDQTLGIYIFPAPLAPLVITNTSLPGGSVGAAYSVQLDATGGQPPYTWQLALGSASLPAGLTLTNNGCIGGTPTTAKTNTFKIQVTDASYNTTNKIFSIIISPNLPPCISSCCIAVTNMVINAINGVAGKTYQLLVSTNLALPINQWTPVATNVLSASGNFSLTATNAISPATREKYFILQEK